MTDVLVTRRFPGGKEGAVIPLDEHTQLQVQAGNAVILDDATDADAPDPVQAPDVLRMHGTGSASDSDDDSYDDHDADTSD